MQNKPNLRKSQMFITVVSTTNYSEKCAMDTWSKQTQSNPIKPKLARLWRVYPPKFTHLWWGGFKRDDAKDVISVRRTSMRGRGIASSYDSVDGRDERGQEDCVLAWQAFE